MLQGKKILLGVCGSIAAYKSAYLVRELVKRKAEVKVIMTTSASDFISALTLSTLSKNPVLSEFTKNKQGEWNNHVELALWADLMVVAPATANTIAKLSNGLCDNLLTATYLSARCNVMICPAMDLDMYKHPSTQQNFQKLKSYNNIIIDAVFGELASGLEGKGRMAEPEYIAEQISQYFKKKKQFESKHIMITAGPTVEPIDPVRFVSNHSTGKMGYAIAQEFLNRGAKVILISGPVNLKLEHQNLNLIHVKTAAEMHKTAIKHFKKSDITVLSAAVADFKPETVSSAKIKKGKSQNMPLNLTKTVDIAKELGKIKSSKQIIVGFALETDNEQQNARKKLIEKNFDFVVLNSLKDKNAGFGFDTNKISIVEKNKITKFELKSKQEVAQDLIDFIFKKTNA